MPERLLTVRELNWEALTRQILLDREALSGLEDPRDLVLRYLVVFPCRREGIPGVVGLTRMKEIVGVLRPELRAFCDENAKELLALSELPRPRRCTALVRFMPDYVNLNLSSRPSTRDVQ